MRIHKHLALVAIAAVSVAAQARTSDEAAIRKMYARVTAAMKTLSIGPMIATEAPGYYEIDDGTKKTAPEVNGLLKEEVGKIKSTKSFDMKFNSIKVKGATAVVKSSSHFEFVTKDQHTFEVWQTSQDNLVKGSKGWLVQSSIGKTVKIKRDGKPMALPKS
jgi:hypothetical protein